MNMPPIEKTRTELQEKLVIDLFTVINNSRIDIGKGLNQIDVIGALEWVKLWYANECFEEVE